MECEDEYLTMGKDEEEEEKIPIWKRILHTIGAFFIFVFIEHIGEFFTIVFIGMVILVGMGLDFEKEVIYEYNEYEILEKHVRDDLISDSYFFIVNDSGEREAVGVRYREWLEAEVGDMYIENKSDATIHIYLYEKEI